MNREDIKRQLVDIKELFEKEILSLEEYEKERHRLLGYLKSVALSSSQSSSPSMNFEEGLLLLGRYQLEKLLGQGGMAQVFRYRDRLTKKRGALKILDESRAAQGETREKFINEFEIIHLLDHEGIVKGCDLFSDPKTKSLFFTMELVEGESLKIKLKRKRQKNEKAPFSLSEVQELFRALLPPIDYAHEMGVVHRDLKPSNIMLLADNKVKIMDFGIAKIISYPYPIEHTGYVGTIQYMSPEQLRGGTPVRPTSDIYSLGVIAYELLTGLLPMGNVKKPSEWRSDLSKDVDAVLMKAMEQNPEERFQTAFDFVRALSSLSTT